MWADSMAQLKTGRMEINKTHKNPQSNRKDPTQAHCLKWDTRDDSAMWGNGILLGFRIQHTFGPLPPTTEEALSFALCFP